MIYIITKNDKEFRWKIGEEPLDILHYQISFLQANCEEADEIVNRCKGIPYSNSEQVTWFGDMAKFIAQEMGVIKV